ncbi:ATP-NAD kinase-like domain-containing protein [Mortierella sp. GBAus27b]|nr:ATP-NAD kinase-like domain-containing protein [Mortierella sp. GBAus27b]
MSKGPRFQCKTSFEPPDFDFLPTILRLEPLELVFKVGLIEVHTIRVPFCCIYGYQDLQQDELLHVTPGSHLHVPIHYVAFTSEDLKASSSPRTATVHILLHHADASRFVTLAKELGAFPKTRRILLLVNPKGGIGKAKTTSDSIVKPMLEHSGLIVQEQYTEYGKHAVDIAHKVDLSQVDTLAVVSGDGVLHEIINGLLSRPDWDQARRLPIAIIPAGSGNAIATSLGTKSPIVATLALIRGETSKLDIFSLSQPERPQIFSMLLFSWGMMADADIESDKYRWLGPLRFEIAGFIRMIRLRRYAGKVYVLPPGYSSTSSAPSEQSATDPSGPALQFESVLKNTQEEPPKPWRLLPNMPFYSMLLALNCPSAGEDLFFTDTIRFNDGKIRLWYSCETRFWKIVLPFVLDMANGKLVTRGLMQDVECGGLLIVPGVEGKPDHPDTHEIVHPDMVTSETARQNNVYTKPGVFDVDGEVMPTTRTLIKVLPSFMEIVVPEWFHNDGESNQASTDRDTDGKRPQVSRAKAKAALVAEIAKGQKAARQKALVNHIIWDVVPVLLVVVIVVASYVL